MTNSNNVKFRFKFSSQDAATDLGSAFDDFKIYQDDTLALTSNISNVFNNDNEFIIFPNPAKNILQVKVTNTYSNANIQIIDITGKVVISVLLNETKQNINVSELNNGVYFIKVGAQVKKFIKE